MSDSTLTPLQERDDVCNQWQLDCYFNNMFN